MNIGHGWESQKKDTLGRPISIWMDNITSEFREEGWVAMDWIYLAQDMDQCRTLVNMITHFGLHKIQGISSLIDPWLLKRDSALSN